MLAEFVGKVDVNSAAVLISIVSAIGTAIGIIFARWKTKRQFELDKMKFENERDLIALNRAKVDQHSH